MNKLLTLPKISDAFTAHVKGRSLTKNEWMPCPRCGQGEVTPPTGKGVGIAAGFAMMGCLGLGGVIVTIIAIAFLGPFGIALGLGIGIVVLLSPMIGAALGSSYKCKSCEFIWNFKNVEDLIALARNNP